MNEACPSIRKAYHPELVVLVVEDQLMFSKDVKHALPQHKVVFARSLEEARSCYDEQLPDMVFLDITLPDGDGFALLDYIRAREPDAYIIILTGSKLEEDVAIARQKGAQGYIIKPFTRSKIEHYLSDYLVRRAKTIQSQLRQTNERRADRTSE